MSKNTQTTQYLSFKLGEEVFAIDISRVREVLDVISITRVPQTPSFMRGVINLRGGVVPVIDMKHKFGIGETEQTVNTCIIIVEVSIGEEKTVLGAMADSVQEVFDLKLEDMEPSPKLGTQINTDFLLGMGKKGENFILLLDIDRVFSMDELAMVSEGADIELESEEQALSV